MNDYRLLVNLYFVYFKQYYTIITKYVILLNFKNFDSDFLIFEKKKLSRIIITVSRRINYGNQMS